MPITFQVLSKKRPAAIYIRFREGRAVDARARTMLTVNPEDWSSAKGKAKENNATNKALNSEIEILRRRLIERLNKRKPNEQVTTQWLKEFITPIAASNNLVQYYDSYIKSKLLEVQEGKIKPVMLRRYNANRNFFTKMQQEVGTIAIEAVNHAFIVRLKEYCKKHGYAQSTTARTIKYLITICRDARKRGLQTHPDIDNMKEKATKTKHIYLTFEELDKIQAVELPDYLDNARDWLIISCYTGQRVSDFMRFKMDFIKTEQDKQLIEFTQVKTKKVMTIPVHKKVQEILNKRGEFPRVISDQRYNDYIKEVCQKAGITQKVQGTKKDPKTNRNKSGIYEKWELVSSHIGRRSFASNFFGQIPTSLLMFVTGHTTETQFYAYIGKTERTQAIQLAQYF